MFIQQPTVDWGMGANTAAQPQGGAFFNNGMAGMAGFGPGPMSMAAGAGTPDTGEFNSNPSSVHSYAYAEDRNQRFRPHMEDTYCIVDKVGGDPSCGLFAIFDGHGGKQVADHCAERFPIELRKELQKNPQDLCKPIIDIFNKVSNRTSNIRN